MSMLPIVSMLSHLMALILFPSKAPMLYMMSLMKQLTASWRSLICLVRSPLKVQMSSALMVEHASILHQSHASDPKNIGMKI